MNDDNLFALALEILKGSYITQTIIPKIESPNYDYTFGKRICSLMFLKCGSDVERYKNAIKDFVDLSEEFVNLQMELDRTGSYRFSSYDEVLEQVYENPNYMLHCYLNGIFLSQAFWVNHTTIFSYFIEEFCLNNAPSGTVLEVPSGTGLFISEFARRNSGWIAEGIDISDSSVIFSKEVVKINGDCDIAISKKDIFELSEDKKYDRIICGELLEHLEAPEQLLGKLAKLINEKGKIFLTTAIWAASVDHIYLFKSAQEVRYMLKNFFTIESELVLNVRGGKSPENEKTPINYACLLAPLELV